MADVKISALPTATTPLGGTEVLPIVQSGTTKKVSIADVTAGRAISASSLTLSSPLGVASGGTGLNSLTAGRIPYGDGTSAFGNSANLFWDAANNQLDLGAGTVSAPSLSTISDTNTGIYFPAADTIGFVEGGVEAMRVSSAGNVGINSTSASLPLTIAKGGGANPATSGSTQSSGGIARIGSSGVASLDVGTYSSGAAWMQVTNVTDLSTNYNLVLQPNGGNVGIGTASPNTALYAFRTTSDCIGTFQGQAVASSGTGRGGVQLDVNGTGGWALLNDATSGTRAFTISSNNGYGNGTAEMLRIDTSGNMLLGTTSSPTSGTQCLTIETGTAATASPADTITIYSTDRSAGNTIPSFYCEGAGVTNAGITNVTVTHKIAMRVNGTIYYLLATTNAT
jgi:hypothetical protein